MPTGQVWNRIYHKTETFTGSRFLLEQAISMPITRHPAAVLPSTTSEPDQTRGER
jgi:hypothetical protein